MFVEFVFEQPCFKTYCHQCQVFCLGQPWVSCTERHCGTSMWPTLVPDAVFLQLQTLKSLKRLKSRTLMSSVLSLWRQRSALFYPERETICGALHAASGGLGMRIQCLWGRCDESDGNVWACVCVMSSHSAWGQRIKPPVISVSLNPHCPSTLLISVTSTVQHWSLTYASYWRLNTLHLSQTALTTGTTRHPLFRCQSSSPT